MADRQKTTLSKKVRKILFALGCVVIAVLFALDLAHHEPINESFLDSYDNFDRYERVSDEPSVYEAFNGDDTVGYLVVTGHYGYQSEVVMATLVNLEGNIVDTRAYSQEESPSYFRKLIGQGFFKKNFMNKPIENGFSIETNVDAISHATISSNAATKAINEGVTYVGEHYLETTVAKQDTGVKVGYLDALVLVMLILALVASRFSKNAKLKWVCRVYSIVVMGFMASQFITLSVLVALFSLDWPSVVDYLRWYLLVFGALIMLLATGKNTYCAYICPFGALQEVVFAFGGPIGKKPLNPTVTKVLKWSPGILVFVSLALTLGFHNLDFANYEPFSLIFGQVGVGIQWALLPLVFVGALFSRRIYCNFACPVGYVLTKIVMLRAKVAKAVKGGKGAKAAAAGAAGGEAAEAVVAKVDAAADAVPSAAGAVAGAAGEGADVLVAKPKTDATKADAGDAVAKGALAVKVDAAAKAASKNAKERKPMKVHDVLVFVVGLAIAVVSLLAIINATGVFSG